MRRSPFAALLFVVTAWVPVALAEGDAKPALAPAAAEIDAQIAQTAAAPPDIEIVFDPLSDERYKLLSASFELDDDPLPFDVKNPQAPLFHGKLTPGPHLVSAKVVYNEAQGSGIFQYEDYKLTVQSDVRLLVQKGLRSKLHLLVEKHPGAPQKKRLTVASRVDSEMLAQIDDSTVNIHPELAQPAPPAVASADVAPKPAPQPAAVAEADDASERSTGASAGSRHKARRRMGADAIAAATLAAAPVAPPVEVDAGPALPPDSGPVAVAAPEPPSPASPAPVAPAPDDSGRQMIGFALFATGVAIAAIAWFFTRRKK